ncbi:MAG: type II toxin-antitoxin system RelE/ParE family toxin [Pseudomonadota bacterium]
MSLRKLEAYTAPNGRKPFEECTEALPEEVKARIDAYVERVRGGAARRNVRRLKGAGGISEIRIDTGPGYRVYFGGGGDTLVLLDGGTKRTQEQDIDKAEQYWRAYHETIV